MRGGDLRAFISTFVAAGKVLTLTLTLTKFKVLKKFQNVIRQLVVTLIKL